jgi:hypothetical protein
MRAPLTRNEPASLEVERALNSPLTSLRATPNASGGRSYVGDGQVVTVNIVTLDTPTPVAIRLDHVPTDAIPMSGIKLTDGDDALAVAINEVHDAGHVWTRTQAWFSGTMSGISAKFLIL